MNTITGDITKTTNEIFVDGKSFEQDKVYTPFLTDNSILKRYLADNIDTFVNELQTELAGIKGDWISISNKKVYYVKSKNYIVPDVERFAVGSSTTSYNIEGLKLEFEGYTGHLLSSDKEVLDTFYTSTCPFRNKYSLISFKRSDGVYYGINRGGDSWYFNSGHIEISYHIPVYEVPKRKSLLQTLVVEHLIPTTLSKCARDFLCVLSSLYQDNAIEFSDDNIQLVESANVNIASFVAWVQEFQHDDFVEDITDLAIDGELPAVEISNDDLEDFCKDLLECDTYRVGLDPYRLNKIIDVNDGHWELWSDSTDTEDTIKVKVNKTLVGRNPLADVKKDGIIGIDFGTKSTVVAYQDGSSITNLFRIGTQRLANKISDTDYENPTMMEFIDLDSFLEAYNSREGRPKTSWETLKVSHTANSKMGDISSRENYHKFSAYFYRLKQWCNSTEKNKLKVIDINSDKVFEIPPYLSLNPEDTTHFDPIEIYAYYLGLFINNMRNGIYLNYWMSFPVGYTKAVRQKIIESFTRGIKKSLPLEVIDCEEVMSNFKVNIGTTEPASYAICALQEFNIEPNEDENIFYGVFDFGGGTTDFDFGIYRYSDETKTTERFKDYVVERFGENGDQYLGGENLLELLAFEIFKANKDSLLATEDSRGFQFCKPEYCTNVAGCETLIDNTSQIARLNTRQLVEVLRPFWEHLHIQLDEDGNVVLDVEETQKYVVSSKFKLDGGFIEVGLFDNEGNYALHTLKLDDSDNNIHIDLLKLLEDRISKGVELFCQAMQYALSSKSFKAKERKVCKLVVFLGGNSSQSPLVETLFTRYTNEYFENICNCLEIDVKRDFEVYPPLGSEKAIEIQTSTNSPNNNGYVIPPNGKTGVAYGLIESRPSSKILVLDEIDDKEEVSFPYYIGYEKRRKFYTVIPRAYAYNQWKEFTSAVTPSFELYYSKRLDVQNGGISVRESEIYKKLCSIPQTYLENDVFVYVRIVSPNALEYVVAKQDGITKEEYLCEPIVIEL